MSSKVLNSLAARAPVQKSRPCKVIRPPSISLSAVFRRAAALRHHRDLIYTLSTHRINVRYKQSQLGLAWAILQPLSLMLIYTLIFSHIAKLPSEGLPYTVFSYAALLPWIYFSSGITTATNGMVS